MSKKDLDWDILLSFDPLFSYGACAEQLKCATTAPLTISLQALVKFSGLVKDRTNGALDITVIPLDSWAMIPDPSGSPDGKYRYGHDRKPILYTFEPFLNVLDLPYLFRSFSHADRVLDGEIGKEMLSHLEKHGMKGLGFLELASVM